MAIEPAAISARPAVTTIPLDATAPLRPAASANGTVRPSDMPMTTSRTVSLAVKWRSVCGVRGMARALCRVPASGCVELRDVSHVRDELLHVERLAVDHVDRILQIAIEVMLGDGRGQDGPVQELRLMLAHVREDRVAVDARHHQVEQDDAVAVFVQI